jgi:cell filamentation protein
MTDDPYLIPGTSILQNKLGLKNRELLDNAERAFTTQRASEGAPTDNFDIAHLKAIHKHLFQDIYSWAGELRSVEISKEGNRFQFRKYIEAGMSDIHKRIIAAKYFRRSTIHEFAEAVGPIIGDLNYCHPFREGNGRTQLIYLQQLAKRAGHSLDIRHIDPATWIEASKAAHGTDYRPMTDAILSALIKSSTRSKDNDKSRDPT